MCGICGVRYLRRPSPADAEHLDAMNRVLRHRGPDDAGAVRTGSVGLAMRRLAIVDLVSGQQPMSGEDGGVSVVFNGEIYNYRALRDWLSGRGHRFRTASDTEVLVHLYEELGRDCLDRLDGMFAFAVWDARRGELFLARDRLGEKPLVYYQDDERLLFASEIKAILQHPGIDRSIDPAALDRYFTYLSIPAPATIYRRIRKLPPGHFLLCDAAGAVSVAPWWDAPTRERPHPPPPAALERELDRLLTRAVEERLEADVPLGAFLSGGLDSSLIVALMARLRPEPVKTFAVGFDGPGYFDELAHARAVARHCGTDHHEIVVRPAVADDLPRLVWHWDEPFAVSSAVPTYYLARAAREHVGVVLTGDGSDELFAGYSRYFWDRLADHARRYTPDAARASALALMDAAVATPRLPGRDRARKTAKFLRSTFLEPDPRYAFLLSNFDVPMKRALYSDAFMGALEEDALDRTDVLGAHYRHFEGGDRLNRRLYADLKTTLADEMLAKVDRMTMAVGLEARPPFLDHQLVEWVSTLPGSAKRRPGRPKHLLRRVARAYLPARIVERRKHGFEVPLDHWLRTDLRPLVHDFLDPGRLRRHGILDPEAVARIVRLQQAGRPGLAPRLWAILMLEMWWDAFAEAPAPRPDLTAEPAR